MATLEQLSAALIKADAAGNSADAKALANAIQQLRGPTRGTALGEIPTAGAPQAPVAVAPVNKEPVGFRDALMGIVETPLALASGAIGGVVRPLAGMYGEITSPGKMGSPEALQAGQAAMESVSRGLYRPQSQTAQAGMEGLSNAMNASGIQGVPLNMLSELGRAAPAALRAQGDVTRANVAAPVQQALAKRAAQLNEQRVAQSFERGPIIDAAQAADRQGLAVNPAVTNPTLANRTKGMVVGSAFDEAAAKANAKQTTNVVRNDLGLTARQPLNEAAVDAALNKAGKPFDVVRRMPVLQTTANTQESIGALRIPERIGDAGEFAAVGAVVDKALGMLSEGRSGTLVLEDIHQLRKQAQKTYKARDMGNNPSDADVATADARMGIANALEGMIDANVADPSVIANLRAARTRMAQIYDHDRAINYANNSVNPQAYAKMLDESKGKMTGVGADIGKVAATFPEVMSEQTPTAQIMPAVKRSGIGAAVGALVGGAIGNYPGALAGAAVGGSTGLLGTRLKARGMTTPEYQASRAMPTDYRVNALRPVEPSYSPNALVPFDPRNAVVPPGMVPESQGFSAPFDAARAAQQQAQGNRPNFVFAQPEAQVNVSPPGYPPQLGAPSAESTMASLAAERARRLAMERSLGADVEARQAATEASQRQTTGAGADLVFDAAGNLVEAPRAGAGGVVGAPSSLESAVAKIAGQMQAPTATEFTTSRTSRGTRVKTEDRFGPLPGRPITSRTGTEYATTGETTTGPSTRTPSRFDLTAEEKIAWDKASADLASASPELGKLTPLQIAGKMMDRQWVADTVQKVREKAQAFDDIAKRSAARIAESEAAQAANEASRQPFGSRAFDEPLSNQLRSKAERRQAGPRAFDEVAKQASAIADRDRMLDLLTTLEDTLRPPRRAAGGAQGPKTREFLRNQLLTGTENNNALAPRITIGGIGRDETKR